MPAYNRAFCIATAIDSLLCQTCQDFELIIVDDGSSDYTGELIKQRYEKEINRGKIIYKYIKHAGVCKARNEALKLSKNPWIAYLDSDNTVVPEFLEVFAEAVKKNKAKVYYAWLKQNNSGVEHGRQFDFKELLRANYIDMGAFVHARSLIDELGGFDEKLTRVVDWDIILRYTRKYKPVYIPRIVVAYNDSKAHDRISTTVDHTVNTLQIYEKNHRKLPPVKKQKILGLMRYSCRCDYAGDKNIWDEKYLHYRYKIFKEITLKSLEAQSDRNFNLVLFHSVNLPEKYKRRFQIMEYNYPFLHNFYLADNDGINNAFNAAAEKYLDFNQSALCSFRLDNDDAVPRDYIKILRGYTKRRFCGYALSLPEITLVQRCGQDRYFIQERLYPSNAIGLAMVSCAEDFSSVMALGHHGKVCQKLPLLCLPEPGGMQTINGENVANHFTSAKDVVEISSEELKQRLASRFPDFDFRCLKLMPEKKLTGRDK